MTELALPQVTSPLLAETAADWLGDLSRAGAERSVGFSEYKRRVWGRWEDAPHFALLDSHLTQVARFIESGGAEGVPLLIVEMPPRHGKSTTLCRLFPTWFLGRNPNRRVIMAAHTSGLAYRHSRVARNIIGSPMFKSIFRARLAQDSQAVSAWNLSAPNEGGCEAMGVMASVVGLGADLLIIDDPFTSREAAESLRIRDKIWDAYTSDFLTRLDQEDAGIIILSQRWHVDDLISRILDRQPAGSYLRLTLRAIAEGADDPLGRQPGEALWPNRLSKEWLMRRRESIGEYAFRSMYQQQPYARSGGLWQEEWLERERLPIGGQPWNIERTVVAIDPAVSSGDSASETGIIVVAIDGAGRGYVLEDASGRETPAGWAGKALAMMDKWAAETIVAEANQGGDMVEHTVLQQRPHAPVRMVRASKGKMARAEPISALYERGQISHVGRFADLESQMLTYTGSARDASPDRLDALCWGMHELFPMRGEAPIIAGLDTFVPLRPAASNGRRMIR